MKVALAKLANRLYDRAPQLHRAVYRAYKAWSDRAERAILSELLTPGMTVFDVGANIGVYTRFIAEHVGRSGHVVAFEPESRNIERLQMAMRDLPQVEVVHGAVSDRSGTLQLYIADDLNVDHHSYPSEDVRRCVEVPAFALDDFLASGARVDLIKMDIQGAEFSAVRGARRMLSENAAPTLLMEYWPYGLRAAGEDPRALLTELEALGYSFTTVKNAPLPDPDCAAIDDYINLVASKAHLTRLGV